MTVTFGVPGINGVARGETDFNDWCFCDDGPHEGHAGWMKMAPNDQMNAKVGDLVEVWDDGVGLLCRITARMGASSRFYEVEDLGLPSGSTSSWEPNDATP